MTTIQAASAVNAKSTAAPAGAKSTSEVADRFLTLLVTQLQNQDPLNPMDNAQLTSQLAQLSTVNGINQLNDTMSGLVASFGASQYLQATALIGHDALVAGNGIDLAAGKGNGGFALAARADNVTVTISDAAGRVVRRLDLGAQPEGVQRYEWDGRTDAGAAAPAGHYTVTVAATIGASTTSIEPLASGRVTGVAPGANGAQVQIAGIGPVDLSSIRQVN